MIHQVYFQAWDSHAYYWWELEGFHMEVAMERELLTVFPIRAIEDRTAVHSWMKHIWFRK